MNKNNIIKNIIFMSLFWALNYEYINCSGNKSDREMVILIDNQETTNSALNVSYNKKNHDMQSAADIIFGAMTLKYLNALHQEVAPILISKSLVANVLKTKSLLQNFIDKDKYQLLKEYGHTKKFKYLEFVELFRTSFNKMYDLYNFTNDKIQRKLRNSTKKNHYKTTIILKTVKEEQKKLTDKLNCDISKYFNNTKYAKLFTLDIITNIILYSVKYENWLIKNVNRDFYLLIPKKYISKLDIKTNDILYKPNLRSIYTDIEIKLGLKINHLKDVNIHEIDITDNKMINYQKTYNKNFLKAINKIFITKSNSNQFIHKWAFYCSGHGASKDYGKIVLPQLQNLRDYYMQNNQNKLKDLDLDINYFNYYDNNSNNRSEGSIINIDKQDFTSFLNFLNDEIETAFLYYSTCFSGGSHLIDPYIKNSESIILNYDVVSEALSENYAMQEIPLIRIPDIKYLPTYKDNSKHDVSFKNRKLKIKVSLDLKKFFKCLNSNIPTNNKKLKELIYNINPYFETKGNNYNIIKLYNLPSIRHRNSDKFNIIPDYANLCIINEIDNKFNISNKKYVLLYTDYIKNKITLEKKTECILSMTQDTGHVFESIESKSLDLNEILSRFLFFRELTCPKFFWIKKLICKDLSKKQKYIELTNVIITNHILNSEKINESQAHQDMQNYNYIYFQDKLNDIYKIILPKNFDQTQILNINKTNFQDYTKETLVLQPNLREYI